MTVAALPEHKELGYLFGQVGEALARNQSCVDRRLDQLETDVAELKTDVAVLKTDVAVLKTDVAELKTDVAELKTGLADTNARLNRLELATERGFNRMDARFEELITLIVRSERGK